MILQGDALNKLRELEAESVDCCITSPPYFGLRDYGVDGQLGLEPTPEEYVDSLVAICREVRRVLKKEGTFWLNLGDSYAGNGRGGATMANIEETDYKQKSNKGTVGMPKATIPRGLKPKDLIGIPWKVAFALQADGWWLRQDIIWSKPNPMPESVTDRCTKSHEYIFLLSKAQHYYFDADSIKEPITHTSALRLAQDIDQQEGSFRVPGKTNGAMKAVGRKDFDKRYAGGGSNIRGHSGALKPDGTPFDYVLSGKRNKRSVWSVSTKPFKEAHFATYPVDLVVPMVKAGCPEGGLVLDPFFGSGTTGLAASKCGRKYLGIEINPDYIKLAEKRLAQSTLF